jgi:hypothetical protein
VDVEGLGQENGSDGPGDAQRAHDDEGQDPPVDRQVDDVGEGEEADAGDERGDAHRLRPQHRRQQLPDKDVEHCEGRSYAELADHRERYRQPHSICPIHSFISFLLCIMQLRIMPTLSLLYLRAYGA